MTALLRRDSRGSGSALMMGVMVVVLTLGAAALVTGGYLVAAHRARAAADLGAVSGAAAVLSGSDGCDTARRIVHQQSARMRHCDVVGDQMDFVVTVAATVPVPLTVAGLPRTITAVGHAGPTAAAGQDGS